MRILLTIGFLTLLTSAFGQEAITQNTEDSLKILADDPIMAMLDSMYTAKFLEGSDLLDENDRKPLGEWMNSETIKFPDSVYEARLKALDSETPFHLAFNEPVKNYIHAYTAKNRIKVGRMLGLAEYYFPLFEEMLDLYNLPLEFKYLAIVESALNPTAKSRSGAMGLWQFMYRTGKIYDLNSTSYVDERRDPFLATKAACEYFQFLYSMFGDYNMVLAAYNGGPGTLTKAIRRSGGKRDYWEVRPFLPRETRGYVPAFIAVNYVMNYAKEHKIYPEAPDYFYAETDTIIVTKRLDLYSLSAMLNIPVDELTFLNPMYRRHVIPPTKDGYPLVIPKEKIGVFLTNEKAVYEMGQEDLNLAFANQNNLMAETRKTHKVRYGETLGGIASKYRCRVSELRDWNGIRGNLIREGQRLVVYSKQRTASTTASSKTSTPTPKGFHTVKKGDTLWGIAKNTGVTISQLLKLNNISSNATLKVGSRLKIG